MILSAENITKQYIETKVLDDVSLFIQENDKIGVVGINGTGKSTLLKILTNQLEPDAGKITLGRSVHIAYLAQNPDFRSGGTVLEEALRLCGNNASKEYEIKSILNRLQIHDFDAPIQTLSGGQKKRVALASVLASSCELLILDEPTNHIDSDMTQWLEAFLIRFKGAVLMITHDRYFLDRVCNRIIEVDKGRLYSYPGNFSAFLETKAAREEAELASERKRQSILRTELAWMMRGARARSTKQKARIERFEALSSESAPAEKENVQIQSLSSRLGGKTIQAENITKAYGERMLINDFSYIVARDDRLGIIGANGCGKSTLLKLMSGKIAPDSGSVTIGDTVKIGYFSQEYDDMDPSEKVIDYIRKEAEYIQLAEGKVSASKMLERFLFPSELHWTRIEKLSGGEKRRLYLLRVLISAPNILFLDEPTNDLDTQTLAILEDYLDSFSGAVITVSHDRFFLDRVVSHVIAFEDGCLREYNGGFTDYMQNREAQPTPKTTSSPAKEKKERPAQKKKLKFTYKEQKEYETIDDTLQTLESELTEVEAELAEGSSDYIYLEALTAKQQELKAQLEQAEQRWIYLTELAEKIEAGETE